MLLILRTPPLLVTFQAIGTVHQPSRVSTATASPATIARAGTVHTVTGLALSSPPPLSQFTGPVDRFLGPVFAPHWWNISGAAVVDGRAILTQNTAGSYVETFHAYSLYNSQLVVEYQQDFDPGPPLQTAWMWFVQEPTGADGPHIMLYGGNLYFGQQPGFDNPVLYDPVDHRWWKISEAAGTVYWETSPNGLAWTVRFVQAAAGGQLGSGQIELYTARSGTNTTYAYFDNLNAPPVVAPPQPPPSFLDAPAAGGYQLTTGRSAYGSGQYHVEIFEYDGVTRRKHVVLDRLVEDISAGRELNGVSDCKFTVRVPNDPERQERLRALRTARFETDVWRDDLLLWSGPITQLRYTRTGVAVTCNDFLWWLSRRFVRTRLAFANEAGADGVEDLALIAEKAVRSALAAGGDKGLLRWLTVKAGGLVGAARYELIERVTALDVLDELVDLGLHFTALGRQIFLVSGGVLAPHIGKFTDLDFAGEVEVVETADEACTLAAATSGGLVGEWGGQDPYFGLIERRVDAPTNQTKIAPLIQAARHEVNNRNPPPVFLRLPDGGSLSPACLIDPAALIPGAKASIEITQTLRHVVATMMLTSVRFSRTGGQPEQVAVQFRPVGALANVQV